MHDAMMPLLFLPIALILIAAGRAAARLLGLPQSIMILERNLAGFAVGLGILSYAMLVIGLAGGLYPAAPWALLAVFAALGAKEIASMAREAKDALQSCFHPQGTVWLLIGTLALFGALALVGVLAPPVKFMLVHGALPPASSGIPGMTYTEFDSLSYHLADPKIFILSHRIHYIPWEYHSNFAFTAEMWYMWAMLAVKGSIPLAKMFHWSCWLATSLAVYAFGSRRFSVRTGVTGAILFATTPMAFWEAGTAYVDLSTAFFLTASLMAVAAAVQDDGKGWLKVSAVLMGFALGTKATAAVSLVLIVIGLLWWKFGQTRSAAAALKTAAAWAAIAVAIGCPWYIKTFAYTGNPVFPLATNILGGKYWNADCAKTFESWNAKFGLGHKPIDLLLAPWSMTMFVMPGHPAALTGTNNQIVPLYPFLDPGNSGDKPFNDFPSEFATLSPVLLAGLFAPLLLGKTRRLVKALAFYALAASLLSFIAMQYARYLLPIAPVLCLLTGYLIDQLLSRRSLTGRTLAAFTAVSFGFSAVMASELAGSQSAVAFGRQDQTDYIEHGLGVYPAIDFVNKQLPADASLVFYGNPLGFYCDKPYMWGEKGFSAYIPYESMHSAQDLLAEFHKKHITHILVDTTAIKLQPATDWTGWLYELTAARSNPLFSAHGVAVYALPAT